MRRWKGEGEGITKSEMVRRLVEVVETGQYTAIPHSSKPSVQPTVLAKSSSKKIYKHNTIAPESDLRKTNRIVSMI